jgi:hypothetical protein
MFNDLTPLAPAYVGPAQGEFPPDAGPLAQAELIRLRLKLNRLEQRMTALAQPAAPANLSDNEQYRLQMAAISTAAFGYWKEDDDILPDYDTPALRDVARLYAKYESLTQPAAQAVRQDGMPTSADERHLRRLLATQAGIVGLYTDDGEASGEANGVVIDFMRDSTREIQRKLTLVGFKHAEQSLEAAAPQAQPAQAVPDPAERAFIRALFDKCEWPDGGGIDGFEFKDIAEAHGLLVQVDVFEPCGEGCRCAQYHGSDGMSDGVVCYRKAAWLAAAPEGK